MSSATISAMANRLGEHVARHNLDAIDVTFHGGEPLLFGVDRFESLMAAVTQHVPCAISWSLQTNAILLDEKSLDLFDRWNLVFGISLDGGREENDRHRLYRNTSSSFDPVVEAITLVNSRPRWSRLLSGALAVIDVRNDPHNILTAFKGIGINRIDLLLPDATHDSPPPIPRDIDDAHLVYGRWLARFFDIWFDDLPEMDVRFLSEIMSLILGGESELEALGAKSVNLVVVETNGDIEPVDTLKVVGRGSTNIGKSVFDRSFDDALSHPAIVRE